MFLQNTKRIGIAWAEISFRLQGQRENIGDMRDEVGFEFGAHFRRRFFPVRLVLIRQDYFLDAEPLRGEDFFFDAADAEHASAQADFASHGDVRTNFTFGQQRSKGGNDGYARARAVFGRGAGGNMDVNIEFAVVAQVNVEFFGLGTQITDGGLGAFFHDVAERAGENQTAAPTHAGGFDEQDFTANGRPSQAGGNAVLSDFFGGLGYERRMAQILADLGRFNFYGCAGAVARDDFARGF